MIRADYHVHSCYSIDSDEKMENSVLQAINLGINELVFTDHLESFDPTEPFEKIINYYNYRRDLERLEGKYKDKIKLKLGSEINLQLEYKDPVDHLIEEHNLDFIIGSLHSVNYVDVALREYYQTLSVDEYHEKYFKDLLTALKTGMKYSVVGHLDFVTRYGGYNNNKVDLGKQIDYIKPILEKVISDGRGIELNTSGLRYSVGSFHPSAAILSLYKELGGEIITVGSDSHQSNTIGMHFKEAEDLLLNLGFKYYCTFRKMKPSFVKLG